MDDTSRWVLAQWAARRWLRRTQVNLLMIRVANDTLRRICKNMACLHELPSYCPACSEEEGDRSGDFDLCRECFERQLAQLYMLCRRMRDPGVRLPPGASFGVCPSTLADEARDLLLYGRPRGSLRHVLWHLAQPRHHAHDEESDGRAKLLWLQPDVRALLWLSRADGMTNHGYGTYWTQFGLEMQRALEAG